jgi:mono/diheme cytochrome c family protein
MTQPQTTTIVLGVMLAVGAVGVAVTVMAQGHAGHAAPMETTKPSRTITMDELHRSGGVPRGWKFTLPSGGDPAKGRQLFAELECYKCHAMEGAGFPPTGGDGKTGPELTGMGAHHPAEYFAESIIAPNNVLLAGPGWIGPDGRSVMPTYADSLSVAQLLDLVAFIKRQDGGGHAHHMGAPAERAVGPYRVRLVFKSADDKTTGHDHGAHAHHGGAAKSGAPGHLMAFVSDATTGDTVPYLPISAGIQAQGVATRTVKLVPMMGRDGFHYGADAILPSGTQKIVLSIGATTMQVMGPERGRYARAQLVSFDWSAQAK